MLSPLIWATCVGQMIGQTNAHVAQLEKIGWIWRGTSIIPREEAAEECVSTDNIPGSEDKVSNGYKMIHNVIMLLWSLQKVMVTRKDSQL